MASDSITLGFDALVSLAEDAADGAHQHGAAIALAQNTETKIRADMVVLAGDPAAVPPVPGAQALYNGAKTAKTTASSVQRTTAALSDARSAVNDATVALGQAKQTRDAAQRALFERLSGLRAELSQLLEDDDPRWYAFGFDRPADGQQPGPVQNLVLTAGGPGIVLAHWDDARRAERYRVLKQVVGTDAAPVVVTGVLHENELTLQGLPVGQDVKITVAAVNSAGDGPETVSAPFHVG